MTVTTIAAIAAANPATLDRLSLLADCATQLAALAWAMVGDSNRTFSRRVTAWAVVTLI